MPNTAFGNQDDYDGPDDDEGVFQPANSPDNGMRNIAPEPEEG